jgi:hypothetical protein
VHQDPITARGILDAFRDAERCAAALGATFRGANRSTTPWPVTSAGATAGRADVQAHLSAGDARAAAARPRLLGAVHGHRESMDAFVQMNAGTLSPATFFSPANIDKMMSRARGAQG